jgi:Putative zinc dependent peptidase (DUF5700)
MRRLVPILLLLAACATAKSDRRTNLRIVTDEAEAVLAILDARAAGREVTEADWRRVFESEGYVRLKKREHAPHFAQLDQFFTDVLDEKLKGDDVDKRAFEFFGLLGPWYTVGWTMATTIEEELGRETLIQAFCDGRALLSTYDRAAAAREARTGQKLPRWSVRLVP